MRTKKALYNVGGLFISEMVIFISGLILPRLILVAYGSMINGLLASARQFLAYLKYLELGLAGAATLALYKPLAEKNDVESSRVLSASHQFFNRVGFLFSAGAVVVAGVYPFIVPCEGLPWFYVAALILLLAVSGAVGFFLVSSVRVLLIADQRSYVISLVAATSGILTLGVTVWVIRAGFDVIVVPVVSAAGVLLHAWVLHLIARKTYHQRFRFDLPVRRGVIPQRRDVFINELALLVQVNSPIIIVTFFLGLAEVSVFAIYNMVFRSIQSMVRMLSRSLRASFGEIIALGQFDRLRQTYAEYEYLIYLFTSWFYTCAGLLLLSFVRIYTHGVTDADYMRPTLGFLFLIIGITRQLQVPCATIIGAAGKYREIASNSIQVAIISVIFGVVGAFKSGLEGVLLGLAIASVHQTIFKLRFAFRQILTQSAWNALPRIARNATLSLVAWLPISLHINIDPLNPSQWIVWAVGVFVWVGLVLIAGNIITDWQTTRAILFRVGMLLRR